MNIHRRCKPVVMALILIAGLAQVALAQVKQPKPSVNDVTLVITSASAESGSLQWSITNNTDIGLFVYDFFLWGPALSAEESDRLITLNTSPTVEVRSCPPNRVAPVLLLVIAPGRTIKGELLDETLRKSRGKDAVLQISVGLDPYSVVEEAKRFYDSKCEHSPYDAIVRWGTLVKSKPSPVR